MKFNQSNISTQLYSAETIDTFYYFIPGDDGPAGELSFEDSWYAYNGYYIFLNEKASSKKNVSFSINTLLSFLNNLPPQHDERFILWIQWEDSGQILTTIAHIAFKVNQWNNYGDIISTSNFGIGNYTMSVNSSMMLYPSDGKGLLERSDFNKATLFSFLHAESEFIQPGTVQVQFGASNSIPGAITGIGLISDFSDSKASGWDVGFRYFMYDGNNIVSQQYPVFNVSKGNYIEFDVQWDLFNPLVAENTYLKFTGQNFALTRAGKNDPYSVGLSNKQSIPSFFRTRLGHALELTPSLTDVNGTPKLVFQKKVSDSGSDEYYLTPSGGFTISINGAKATDTFELLCGLTGTEYIKFTNDDFMVFTPGNNAMAVNFPAASIANQSDSLDVLTGSYTTAWVQILPAGTNSPLYYSQPESSPLYQKDFQDFPGVYLRLDGTGVTQPMPSGGGTVNCQFGAGAYETFQLVTQTDGTTAIESVEFPGVYLRLDGTGVTQQEPSGGGTVNCQFGAGAYEKFQLVTQTDGTTAIESVQFPGVYLRMDGTGVTQPVSAGGGTVNCRFGVGPNEKFCLVPQDDGTVAIRSVAFSSPSKELPIDIFAYQKHFEGAVLNLGPSEGMNNPASDQLIYNNSLFPVVPYAGIDNNYTIPYLNHSNHTLADFESQAIAPARKQQLDVTSFNTPSGNNVTAITPLGLLVTVDEDTGEWLDVVLAKNQVIQETSRDGSPATTDYTLEFVNLTPQLINAFQNNQQFIVISTNQNIGELIGKGDTPPTNGAYFKNEMSIEGWPFIFNFAEENQAVNGNYSNVMIFKYCRGTLQNLVNAPQNWTGGDNFNSTQNGNSLQGLSAWLSNYIAEGIQEYENGDEDFEQFYEIVTDPNWNGIIGLNVDIDFNNFPPQLEGLLAGINENKFRAHHFGVQVNQPQISATTWNLELGKQSTLFGLINYTSPPLVNGDDPQSDFDFRVLLLKVVFQHSKITNFKGKIQLLVNKLFGSEVIKTMNGSQQSNANELIFNSGFEVHDGYPVYTFTDLNDTRFYVNNSVLNYVEISKASFFTILPKNTATKSNDVNSRFSMWGYMGFDIQTYTSGQTTGSLDLFSFGEDQNSESLRTGLSFSNFWVNMDFNLTTPSDVNFSVEVSHMDFDKALSHIRAESLVKQLPMSVSKIITGDSSNTMNRQGFVPMELSFNTGPNWELPKGKWHGLVFDVNLGTLGDLVKKVSFVAKLLVAWGTENRPGFYPVAVGIALPGVNSTGNLFDLEGILKVTMDGIKLTGAIDTNTNSVSYIIQISDIALKFLGIKLPPGATTEFLIFGDPNGQSNKIGWYGAYVNK